MESQGNIRFFTGFEGGRARAVAPIGGSAISYQLLEKGEIRGSLRNMSESRKKGEVGKPRQKDVSTVLIVSTHVPDRLRRRYTYKSLILQAPSGRGSGVFGC